MSRHSQQGLSHRCSQLRSELLLLLLLLLLLNAMYIFQSLCSQVCFDKLVLLLLLLLLLLLPTLHCCLNSQQQMYLLHSCASSRNSNFYTIISRPAQSRSQSDIL